MSDRVRIALLGVALVALVVAMLPAQAGAAGSAPVVTSPSVGDLVSGDATFTATSDSPFVLFELESGGRIARRKPVAAGADGVFRDVLPTVGLGSFSVRARACSDADQVSCTVAGEAVAVQGLQARLTATATLPRVLDPTVLGRVALRAADLGGYSAMVTGLPGAASGQVHDGEVVDVDLSSIADGDYDFWLRQCNPLNNLICTSRGGSWLVRRAPYLLVSSPALFVSQNGDGFWETAETQVVLDHAVSVTARWRIVTSRGASVAGPYELSPQAISEARFGGGAEIEVDPRVKLGHPLSAGEYRLEVEATASEPEFTKSKRVSIPLHVSNAAPVTKLTPNARTVYPGDIYPGVAHVLRIGPRFDVGEARYGGIGFRILRGDGQPLGGPTSWWSVDSAKPVITWDGRYYKNGVGSPLPAPEGIYRVELIRFPGVGPGVSGPVSAPFTLSRRERHSVERAVVKKARASRLRTLVPHGARVRVDGQGSLRFERLPGSPSSPLVTTFHAVRVPPHLGRGAQLRIRGAWGNTRDVDLGVVTPTGRTIPIHTFTTYSRTSLGIGIRNRWIRADDTARFRFGWHGHRPARMDKVVVRYWKLEWRRS